MSTMYFVMKHDAEGTVDHAYTSQLVSAEEFEKGRARHFRFEAAELTKLEKGELCAGVQVEHNWTCDIRVIRASENSHYIFVNDGTHQKVTKTPNGTKTPTIALRSKLASGEIVEQRKAVQCDRCCDKYSDFTMFGWGEMGECRSTNEQLCGWCDGDHENHCRCRD